MSSIAFRAAIRPPRLMLVAIALLGVLIVSALLSTVSLAIAVAIVGCLGLACLGLALVHFRQYAVVAAICIAVGIFVDWYPVLPYPFGGSGIPTAPIIALALLGYILVAESPAAVSAPPMRVWLWLAVLVLAAPAILAGVTRQQSLNYYGSIIVSPLVFFALGATAIRNWRQFRILLSWLAAITAFIALHTIIAATTGVFLFRTPYLSHYLAIYGNFTFTGTDVSRTGSFLLNPDTNGGFLAFAALIPLGLFLSARSPIGQLVYGAEIVAILWALFLTFAVIPMIALGVSVPCYLVLVRRFRSALGIVAVVSVVVGALNMALPDQISALLHHASQPGERTLRYAIWQTAVDIIKVHPLTGIGLGSDTYMTAENIFRVSQQPALEPEPHNSYLELIAYAGIPFGVAYIVLLAMTLWDTIRNAVRLQGRKRALFAAVPAACISLVVFSLGNSGWTYRPFTWMAWLLLGVGLSPSLMRSLAAKDKSVQRLEASLAPVSPPALPLHPLGSPRDVGAGTWSRNPRPPVSLRPLEDPLESTDEQPTMILPIVAGVTTGTLGIPAVRVPTTLNRSRENRGKSPLLALITDSGVYAIASLVSPFISLALAPFVTHHLSLADYGTLTLITSALALVQFLTQLGLGPAIVRAYNYEYTDIRSRRNLLGTAHVLVIVVSSSVLAVVALGAQTLAAVFLRRPDLGNVVIAAAVSLFLLNLTLPGMAWLLATSRRFTYTVLSVVDPIATLAATVILVGWLQMGILGVIAAGAIANAVVLAPLLTIVLAQTGWHVQSRLVRSLLVVGLPTIPTFVTGWILQLSDRYILSLFVPSSRLAVYSIGYTMGWVLTGLLVSPFVSAWGTRLFTIAKLENAKDVFRLVFRAYSVLLLFAAFGLAMFAPFVLGVLFPSPYLAAAPIATVVAGAVVFNGIYYVLHAGCQITKKLWLLPLYYGVSAATNVVLNLLLIPRLGILGAGIATLLGYCVLAAGAYIGNQIIYPLPFQIMRFALGALAGVGLYSAMSSMPATAPLGVSLLLRVVATVIYGLILLALALVGTGTQLGAARNLILATIRATRGERVDLSSHLTSSAVEFAESVHHQSSVLKVCLHRVDAARSDVRACKAASALRDAGLSVTLIDIDGDRTPLVDLPHDIRVQHMEARVLDSPRFKPWLIVKMVRFFISRVLLLLRSQADVYHALEVRAVLPCFVAGMLRRKPVIYEVYDVPFDGPYFQATAIRRMYRAIFLRTLRLIGPSLAGLIVTSDGHGREMTRLLNRKPDAIVRNIPEYEPPSARDELRQHFGLDKTVRIALYQGYFIWNRALDALICAARHLEPGIIIVLRGEGPTRRELERLIVTQGVQDRVRFAPFVPQNAQMAWTSPATIGLSIYRPDLSPNVQGILPNKVFEYLMAGVPVLNTLPEVANLLEEHHSGRTLPTVESQALARVISQMVNDSEALVQMRRNALLACETELRWDIEKRKLLVLYEKVLGISLGGAAASPHSVGKLERDMGFTHHSL